MQQKFLRMVSRNPKTSILGATLFGYTVGELNKSPFTLSNMNKTIREKYTNPLYFHDHVKSDSFKSTFPENMKDKKEEDSYRKESTTTRLGSSISKIFLITGGTPESRTRKRDELGLQDKIDMSHHFKKDDEMVVVFYTEHDDLDYLKKLTFDKLKELAGNDKLGADFYTKTFITPENNKLHGVIDLDSSFSPSFSR